MLVYERLPGTMTKARLFSAIQYTRFFTNPFQTFRAEQDKDIFSLKGEHIDAQRETICPKHSDYDKYVI